LIPWRNENPTQDLDSNEEPKPEKSCDESGDEHRTRSRILKIVSHEPPEARRAAGEEEITNDCTNDGKARRHPQASKD
jgi:hypothetical protein